MNLRPLPLALFVLACAPMPPAMAGPVSNTTAKILQTAGVKALEKSAREAAEHAAAQAVRHLGPAGAEQAIEKGGLPLLQAAASHGDEVWAVVRRVPEAAGCLGGRPEQAVSLARRLGDDALRLEARAPGMAEQAAAQFGRQSLPILAKAPASEITQLVGYAARADSPATRDKLFDLWCRRGGAILTELDKHKLLILTGGLTAGMIMTADGLQDAIQDLPAKVPDGMRDFLGKTGSGFATFLTILSLGGVTALGWRVWLRRPMPKA